MSKQKRREDMKNMKKVKLITLATIAATGSLMLSSCDNDIAATTIPSSDISFGDNNELNLNRSEIIHIGKENPTAINISVSGDAAKDATCLNAMKYKDNSGAAISFGTSKNATGYVVAGDNEIIYAPSGQCGGKSLTVNVNYYVGSKHYVGFNTLTIP